MHQIKSLAITGPFVIRIGNTVSHRLVYSAATPTGPVGRKLINRDANLKQKIAKFLCKQPIRLKQADDARSKKFDTVTSDHDRSGNCHVFDWLLSILNVLNFKQNTEMSNSQLIIKFLPINKP